MTVSAAATSTGALPMLCTKATFSPNTTPGADSVPGALMMVMLLSDMPAGRVVCPASALQVSAAFAPAADCTLMLPVLPASGAVICDKSTSPVRVILSPATAASHAALNSFASETECVAAEANAPQEINERRKRVLISQKNSTRL